MMVVRRPPGLHCFLVLSKGLHLLYILPKCIPKRQSPGTLHLFHGSNVIWYTARPQITNIQTFLAPCIWHSLIFCYASHTLTHTHTHTTPPPLSLFKSRKQ